MKLYHLLFVCHFLCAAGAAAESIDVSDETTIIYQGATYHVVVAKLEDSSAGIEGVSGFAVYKGPPTAWPWNLVVRATNRKCVSIGGMSSDWPFDGSIGKLPFLNLSSQWGLRSSNFEQLSQELADKGHATRRLSLELPVEQTVLDRDLEMLLGDCSSSETTNSEAEFVEKVLAILGHRAARQPVQETKPKESSTSFEPIPADRTSPKKSNPSASGTQTDRKMHVINIWMILLAPSLLVVGLILIKRFFENRPQTTAEDRYVVPYIDKRTTISETIGDSLDFAPPVQSSAVDEMKTGASAGRRSQSEAQRTLVDLTPQVIEIDRSYRELRVALENLKARRAEIHTYIAAPLEAQIKQHMAELGKQADALENTLNERNQLKRGLQDMTVTANELNKRLAASGASKQHILRVAGFSNLQSLNDIESAWTRLSGRTPDEQRFGPRFLFLYSLNQLKLCLEKRTRNQALDAVCNTDKILEKLSTLKLPDQITQDYPNAALAMRGNWNDGLHLILRAHLILRTIWPEQDEELLASLACAAENLRVVLREYGMRPHNISLPQACNSFGGRFVDFGPKIHDRLARSQRFQDLVRSSADNRPVFCEIHYWGFDVLTNGEWILEDPSQLIAKRPGDSWESPIYDLDP